MTTKDQALKCDTCGCKDFPSSWLGRYGTGCLCKACMRQKLERLQAAVRSLEAEVDGNRGETRSMLPDAKDCGNAAVVEYLHGEDDAYDHVIDLVRTLLKDHNCEAACEVLGEKGTENES